MPLFLSLAALVAIMTWGMLNQSTVTSRSGAGVLGEPASNFTITTFSGETFSLSDFKGNPVVVNFWASWCWPCRVEAPKLEQTWRRFKDEGVVFVGVDTQDFDNEAVSFMDEFDITYPNGPDRMGETTIEYGVGGIPVTFFINRDGVVARRFVGAIEESRMIAWIEELLAGAAPSGEAEGQNLDQFFELSGQE